MNNIKLLGRLTKDVELNIVSKEGYKDGLAISRLTIAVERPTNREETDFITCVAFGRTAETIANYFVKGQPILIDGSLQNNNYEKDGVMQYTYNVVINGFEFVPSFTKEEKVQPKQNNKKSYNNNYRK